MLVLGSGQDGGSPQTGTLSGVGPDRTASSIAVVSPLGSVVLLDASPDIRLQSASLLAWSGYPSDRTSFVDAVAITHGHMGHYAGLLQLGKEAANVDGVRLVATDSVLAFFDHHAPWNALLTNGNLLPESLETSVSIDASTEIRGHKVPHRAEYTDTVGLSVIVDGTPWLFYLPDIDAWETWDTAEATLAGHKVCVIDATFSSADELPGRDMADIRHPLVPDTVARFGHLTTSTRMILSHINHSNRLALQGSHEADSARRAGFEVAYDGMVISV